MIRCLEKFGAIVPYNPHADGRLFEPEYLKAVLQDMLNEAGVKLLVHTQFINVIREGKIATSVIIANKTGLCQINCKQLIDASGDADVVARGHWPFVKGGPILSVEGGEIKSKEPLAQLPMSMYFMMLNTHKKVKPYLPSGYPQWQRDEDLPMITIYGSENAIFVKMKVIGFDATDGESISEAECTAHRQLMAVVYYLQTKGLCGEQYHTFKLAFSSPHIGIREGRRIVGLYTLTKDDLMQGCKFEDAIAVGSYHIDYHWPTVLQRAGTGITDMCPPYHIPFRALRPVESDNLLAVGRCISGDQLAMSSYRVMTTCAQTGYAGGTAAAIAVKNESSLNDLNISELKEALIGNGLKLDTDLYRG